MTENNEFQIANTIKSAVANGMSQGGPSDDQVTQMSILSVLSALGGSRVQEDALTYEGTKFVLPKNYEGRMEEAVRFLAGHALQQDSKTDLSRTFDYRPYDVANAVQQAMRKIFATTGMGVAIKTMFGSIEPEFVTVATGVGETIQVPWNRVQFDALHGHIDIGFKNSPHGAVGHITVNAPRKFRSVVEGFFIAVENELKTGSIYRGKAIVNGAFNDIRFLDLSSVKRQDVVYGDQVMSDLEANIWMPIQYTEKLRANGQPVKRAVLLEGPYGTGKSLAGYLTAQVAVANDWTFIFAKPGSDLNEAMQTAKLYAPAVVFFEDIDVLQSNDPEAVSTLLDSFDGIGGKGQEVIAVLTTNNKDKIHKGMLRPGRLDALIHIADLDLGGLTRLIQASVPNEMLVNIDYDEIFKACEGYLPAFVREVATRAYRYAMVRTSGNPDSLFTEDFVKAAHGLRPQFDLMTGAHEIQAAEGLDKAFNNAFAEALASTEILDSDGDLSYSVRSLKAARK
jgi:hypothetical protein